MRPLLVLLERLWGPLGASLTALGASWGALGRVLGALRGLLGTSLLWKPFIFEKLRFRLGGNTIFKTCPSKEREARASGNHADMRRRNYESMRVREYENMSVRDMRP